ncbi:hypothetical protein TNCV_3316891 [Trichonephila clavipes]|nr:hypothetical protein TNCV_3316891 [Trichonephila clavipes]
MNCQPPVSSAEPNPMRLGEVLSPMTKCSTIEHLGAPHGVSDPGWNKLHCVDGSKAAFGLDIIPESLLPQLIQKGSNSLQATSTYPDSCTGRRNISTLETSADPSRHETCVQTTGATDGTFADSTSPTTTCADSTTSCANSRCPRFCADSRCPRTCADSTCPTITCADSSVPCPRTTCADSRSQVPQSPVQILVSQVPQSPVKIPLVNIPDVPEHVQIPVSQVSQPPMQILPEPMQILPELDTLDPLVSTDAFDQLMSFVFGPQELKLFHKVHSIFDGNLLSFLDEFERGLAMEPMDLTIPRLDPCVKNSIGVKAIQPMDLSVNDCL